MGKAREIEAMPALNEKGDTPNVTMPKKSQSASLPLMGVPGEVQNLVTINMKAGETLQKSVPWKPGTYKVQLMLGRPSYPTNSEYNHSFIGPNAGNSHLRVFKPNAERTPGDPDHMIWWSQYVEKSGTRVDVKFTAEGNADGFLAKFSTTLDAENVNHAVSMAHASLAPLLSGLSACADVPLFIESIDAVELATGNAMLRVTAPFPEQFFNFGPIPRLSDEYCHYASLYSEVMESNSPFYRFLCLFKIVEGLHKRRGRLTLEAKQRGETKSRPVIRERVPFTKEEQVKLLRAVYSIRGDEPWDDMFIGQTFPPESHGKSITQIRQDILEKIRDSIAHALMDDGEPGLSVSDLSDQWKVNKWLPMLRFVARLMLTNEFPTEFQLGAKLKYVPPDQSEDPITDQ